MIKRTLLGILMVLGPLELARADDWPQWRGPDRTDVSKETGLLPSWPVGGPKLLWTFRDAGAGFSCMSIAGDRLYSMGADDTQDYVYAIDLNTQRKLWSTAVGPCSRFGRGDGPRSTPTIDGHFLYALGGHGNLVCVETSGGRKIWSKSLVKDLNGSVSPYGYCESPLVDGNVVVVSPDGNKGVLAALNKKTGTLQWRSTNFKSNTTYSSMIVIEMGGIRQYVQVTHSHVFGVRAADGKLLWEFRRCNADVAIPIYQDNCVYVSSANIRNGCLLKLIPEGDHFKVNQIYANKHMQNDYCGAILLGKYLYGYSIHIGWICQDFKAGKVIWQKNPNLGNASVTYADGHLYGYHEDKGDVVLLKATPAGYQEQGKFRIPEKTKLPRASMDRLYTRPVVANGRLYLRYHELIFCYDVRKPQ